MQIETIAYNLGLLILRGYFVYGILLASLLAVFQEAKIWRPRTVPSLSVVGGVKVFLFNVVWMTGVGTGALLIVIKWILTLGTSDIARDGNCLVERTVAKLDTVLFLGKVKVEGMDNFPANAEGSIPAPIIIANHSSQVDLAVVYFLNKRWKWITKQSVMFIPGVGQNMMLSRHIAINRARGKNKSSVSNLFEKSNEAVQSGIPMFFFPQGTRQIVVKKLFKNGAFVVAQTNKSSLIPVSIDIPFNIWNEWYPINLLWGGVAPTVKLTVHKPIPVTGKEDIEALKKQAMDQIYSVLPDVTSESTKRNKIL